MRLDTSLDGATESVASSVRWQTDEVRQLTRLSLFGIVKGAIGSSSSSWVLSPRTLFVDRSRGAASGAGARHTGAGALAGEPRDAIYLPPRCHLGFPRRRVSGEEWGVASSEIRSAKGGFTVCR